MRLRKRSPSVPTLHNAMLLRDGSRSPYHPKLVQHKYNPLAQRKSGNGVATRRHSTAGWSVARESASSAQAHMLPMIGYLQMVESRSGTHAAAVLNPEDAGSAGSALTERSYSCIISHSYRPSDLEHSDAVDDDSQTETQTDVQTDVQGNWMVDGSFVRTADPAPLPAPEDMTNQELEVNQEAIKEHQAAGVIADKINAVRLQTAEMASNFVAFSGNTILNFRSKASQVASGTMETTAQATSFALEKVNHATQAVKAVPQSIMHQSAMSFAKVQQMLPPLHRATAKLNILASSTSVVAGGGSLLLWQRVSAVTARVVTPSLIVGDLQAMPVVATLRQGIRDRMDLALERGLSTWDQMNSRVAKMTTIRSSPRFTSVREHVSNSLVKVDSWRRMSTAFLSSTHVLLPIFDFTSNTQRTALEVLQRIQKNVEQGWETVQSALKLCQQHGLVNALKEGFQVGIPQEDQQTTPATTRAGTTRSRSLGPGSRVMSGIKLISENTPFGLYLWTWTWVIGIVLVMWPLLMGGSRPLSQAKSVNGTHINMHSSSGGGTLPAWHILPQAYRQAGGSVLGPLVGGKGLVLYVTGGEHPSRQSLDVFDQLSRSGYHVIVPRSRLSSEDILQAWQWVMSRGVTANYVWSENMEPSLVMARLKQLCDAEVSPSGVVVERSEAPAQESMEIWSYKCPAVEQNLGTALPGAEYSYVKCPVIKRSEQTLVRSVEGDVRSCMAAVSA